MLLLSVTKHSGIYESVGERNRDFPLDPFVCFAILRWVVFWNIISSRAASGVDQCHTAILVCPVARSYLRGVALRVIAD